MTITKSQVYLGTFHANLGILLASVVMRNITCMALDKPKSISFNAKPILNGNGDAKEDMANKLVLEIQVKNDIGPFENISYCFRINLRDLFVQCVFSESEKSLEPQIQFIFIDESLKCGFLYFHGIYYMFKFPIKLLPVVPEQWYHVCVSYKAIKHQQRASLRMYLDGINTIKMFIETPPKTDTRFHLDKQWKLGYCKIDHLMNDVRYTRGVISDFNVWSRPLSDDEMIEFTRFEPVDKDLILKKADIIDWRTMNITKVGEHVKEVKVSLKRRNVCLREKSKTIRGNHLTNEGKNVACDEDNKTIFNFAKKTTFNEMALMCKQLGGKMPLPKNEEDLSIMLDSANWQNNDGRMCPSIWLPISVVGKHNLTYKHFEYHKQTKPIELTTVDFLPWTFGQPNGLGKIKSVAKKDFLFHL